jgi:DNA replication and repair protein RecF
LKILRSSFKSFRNLIDAELTFAPKINLIVGKNAQGKTNILEAFYLLSTGRSFRTSKNSQLIQFCRDTAELSAIIEDKISELTLRVEIKEQGKKVFKDTNQVIKASDFFGTLSTICFTPDDLDIIKGSPAERRAFLDKHISDFDGSFVQSLANYSKALKNKQFLLKQFAPFPSIASWNAILAPLTLQIIKTRKSFINILNTFLPSVHNTFFSLSEIPRVAYKSTIQDIESDEEMLEFYNSKFEAEAKIKSCIVGPHRDELDLFIGDKNARFFLSQGQMRSFVLSLKLSALKVIEEKKNDSPIVLLDDIDSELDSERRDKFLKALFEMPRQVFITSTDIFLNTHYPSTFEMCIFKVQDGKIIKKT